MGKKDRDRKEKKNKKEKNQKGKHQNPFDKGERKRKGRGKGKTKQSKDWDKYFKEFNTSLEPKGIFMRDVEGDGNCLFRSIADFVEGDENNHAKYREMAVEYITEHKDYFALFLLDDENIDEYIKDMEESGTWGGHFELVALSSLLNAKFCLHVKDKDPVIVKSSERDLKGVRMIHLAYHVDEHYSSVRRIGDDEKAPAEDIPLRVSESDSDSDSDEEDSTEGSDREVAQASKELEDLHIRDKKKNKNKHEEEEKTNEYEYQKYNKKNKEDDYKGKGKHQKGNDKKEEKGKSNKRKGK
jgi:OTU domain-containing protein 3